MKRSRILWGLCLLAAILTWIFAEGYIGVLLLALTVALPPLCALAARQAAGKLTISLNGEPAGGKGETLQGGITIRSRSIWPLDRVACTLDCHNLLTGETFRKTVWLAVPPRGTVSGAFQFGSRHCGRMRLELAGAEAYDLSGVFRFRIPGTSEFPVLFRPETFGMEVQIAYGEGMNLDSEEYSMQKAGFDPSETFAIREYRPGDRIRQIHWKLSEKLGDLMAREYGLPIQNTILLLLETGRLPGNERPVPEVMDALGEGILSLAQELLEQQMTFSLGWYNHEEGSFTCTEIDVEEELAERMPQLLGAAGGEDSVCVFGHYLEHHEQCAFAHVVVFTPEPREELQAYAGQCLLTEIVCGAPGSVRADESDLTGSVRRILSDPASLPTDLSYLEI